MRAILFIVLLGTGWVAYAQRPQLIQKTRRFKVLTSEGTEADQMDLHSMSSINATNETVQDMDMLEGTDVDQMESRDGFISIVNLHWRELRGREGSRRTRHHVSSKAIGNCKYVSESSQMCSIGVHGILTFSVRKHRREGRRSGCPR